MLRLTILLYESNANWGDILCGWQNHDIIGWIDENILVNANIIDPYLKKKKRFLNFLLAIHWIAFSGTIFQTFLHFNSQFYFLHTAKEWKK